MLVAEFNTAAAARLFTKLKAAVTDKSFDAPVDMAAWKTYRDLVLLTPKKWTGLVRRSWRVAKVQEGQRLVFNSTDGDPKNPNKIMLFLENGTGNAGTATSHGGRIFPASGRFLFIPLKPSAMYGWKAGMEYGVDYILRRSVRGIKAMHIVANYRPKAVQRLKDEMKAFLEKTLK